MADGPVRRWIALGLVVALVGGAVARAARPPRPYRPAATPPYLTIFLVDGLSQSLFQQELAAGRLPAMARIAREGLTVRNGIAAFPSVTGYAFYPLLTGSDAAGSGVLGLRWFDASRTRGNFRHYVGATSAAMNGDFHREPPTLFDCFPAEHSHSINSYANRGADHTESTTLGFILAKYRTRSWLTSSLASLPRVGSWLMPDWPRAESTVVRQAAAELIHRPRVQWITLASLDSRNHIDGSGATNGPLLSVLDGLIAMYRRESEALGTEAERIYLVASDHGVVAVSRNTDLRPALNRLGLRTWRGPATYFRQAALDGATGDWAGDDAVLAINGNTMAYLYLVSDRARAQRAEVGRALVGAEGVELVVSRGDSSGVTIVGPSGEGRIERSDSGLGYTVVHGRDPLHYCPDGRAAGLCDGRPRSDDDWLQATHALGFPYAVPRLAALMAQSGVGDFVVTAAPGYDLAPDYELVVGSYRGGHGGLRADQLRVPYLLSGPGVPRGDVRSSARAEDVGRMIRDLVGCPATPGP